MNQFLMLLIILGTSSCKNTMSNDKMENTNVSNNKEKTIPYTLANNYFVKNNFKIDSFLSLKITNKSDFDAIFGMATTMGESGKPTPIDFSKQYVIALIGKETDYSTSFFVNSLKEINNQIEVSYKETVSTQQQTYAIIPFTILLVNNTYNKQLVFKKVKH